ncbi:MAG: SIS domain-containing protein [Candidatus Omnitrophica bacterium]|nr:SIS domain-containing protein [Candidatus Omnitrophota bacterium]
MDREARNIAERVLNESLKIKQEIKERHLDDIIRAAAVVTGALRSGGKVILCGNGGSAADAQHIAAEFIGRFQKERKAYPAIALSTNTSVLTALANDYGYDIVFSRQIEALAEKKDVVIGISTSGNASNVIKALAKAKELGAGTIALTGGSGGKLSKEAGISIVVPSAVTARIQEAHIIIGHIICEIVEGSFDK